MHSSKLIFNLTYVLDKEYKVDVLFTFIPSQQPSLSKHNV